MKKISIIMIAVLSIAVSCKSKKGAKTVTDKASGMEVITLPCDEFRSSTATAFRATQSQKSSDLSLSREKALVVAKQRLAGLVETKITSVTDRYADEYQTANSLEMKGKYNNLTREIISQQLNDVTILCEKTVKESDGNFSTYVAVEMNKDALKKALENKISSSAKLNIDYDKMKFEQIYNEEMKKLDDAKK
jgi:hypothetical protein